jgi:hypothetical protein
MIHQFAISALLLGTSAAAKSTAKQRNQFMAEMKSANLSLHPSERRLTKDQTPSIETFSDIINGEGDRSKKYRNKILSKAKFVSPEEVKERERNLQNYYANSKYNYNNGQGASSLYSENSNGNAYVGSGTFSNAFGFDPTDYSFAYLRCAEVRQFDDEVAAQEETTSVFSTKHFAVFRFCPTVTCEGMSEKQIEAERQQEYYDNLKSQSQAYADSQMEAYNSARNGNGYNSYDAQNYVKQQAQDAQESGESYEPPSWVFDKRIIGGADGSGCSSNYGEYMLELEGENSKLAHSSLCVGSCVAMYHRSHDDHTHFVTQTTSPLCLSTTKNASGFIASTVMDACTLSINSGSNPKGVSSK